MDEKKVKFGRKPKDDKDKRSAVISLRFTPEIFEKIRIMAEVVDSDQIAPWCRKAVIKYVRQHENDEQYRSALIGSNKPEEPEKVGGVVKKYPWIDSNNPVKQPESDHVVKKDL